MVRDGDVVARIATTTALVRPDVEDLLRTELELVAWLADHGASVVRPASRSPVSRDGHWATLWEYVEHSRERPSPDTCAEALAELHYALRAYPGELPYMRVAIDDVRRGIELCSLSELSPALDALAAEVRSCGSRVQALHGDAHPGNAFVVDQRIVWADFEDFCSGPIEWDLACFAWSTGTEYAASVAPFVRLRSLQAVVWLHVLATRFPERRSEAEAALADWRRGAH